MNKYKIKKFTVEEKQNIQERYSEWMKPENIVWVQKEFEDNFVDISGLLGTESTIEIRKGLKASALPT